MARIVRIYTDYKSPYAFVANAALLDLERTHDVTLEWRPYTLRIAEYLGSVETRSAHDWRKVRYAYMDARRFANAQGLTLKGPKRIYDGKLSSIGMMFAQANGFFPAYHRRVFELFWSHRLDIDEMDQMKSLIRDLGGDPDAYAAFAGGEGRAAHDAIVREAEELGVFGVPTMVLDEELFWGGDRIELLKTRLNAR
jgi:2-hydroxychromene-2-carboxylate isomerase